MRTTLNLDDKLLVAAKHRAVEQRVSLAYVIESALRDSLAKLQAKRNKIRLVTVSGAGVKPGVDLDNGRSLSDIMDNPS